MRAPASRPSSRCELATIDPATGALASFTDATRAGAGQRVLDSLHPVHTARVGRPPLDLLILSAGSGLGVLGLGGALAFARRFVGARA